MPVGVTLLQRLKIMPAWIALTVSIMSCTALKLEEREVPAVAIFDPESGNVPKPTDIRRDADAGRLDFDLEDPELSAAERALYGRLNTLDGWSSASAATLEFSAAVDTQSATLGETVHVVRWGESPQPVSGLELEFEAADTRMRIAAPDGGWERGARYVLFALGGEQGLTDLGGSPVVADEAFYFLRQQQPLDAAEHQRAFPGATREERLQKGRDLEEVRAELAPFMDYAAQRAGDRSRIVSLWSFTVTKRVEVAMDRESQRVPIPFDLLRDRDTGLVDLAFSETDKDIEHTAKQTLNRYDGFSISSELFVPFTGSIDPASVSDETVRFYRIDDGVVRLPAAVESFENDAYLSIKPADLPLVQEAHYAVVLREGLVDTAGEPVNAMLVGHALLSVEALVDESGQSTVSAVDDDAAARLEAARVNLAPVFEIEAREGVIAAWSFKTLEAETKLDVWSRAARSGGIEPRVQVLDRQSALAASVDFALGLSSIANVGDVVTGTITSPYYLDDKTHDFREDGGYEVEEVAFTMTLPREPLSPMPVVIFGHGIMTERRFVLAIANSLAARGMAAVAIDLPFHGTRTVCVDSSPIALVDPRTGEPTNFPPCGSGAECDPERGVCVDSQTREPEGFFEWPVLGYPTASGAAFLEIEKLPTIPSHFVQAYVDLGSLVYALEEADWSQVTDSPLDRAKFYWVGQSLGGIIGAAFVATMPQIERAVFNVPGAGLVDVFDQSTFFRPQIDGYFTRNDIERESYEGRRFLGIARWLMDSVDPHSIAHRYRSSDQRGFVQMAVGDIIVPNVATEALVRIGQLPKRDYIGTHGFLSIPEPAALPGLRDMGDFLSGEFQP